ncbi:MAG: carbonic anhydrase [Steroidobacteraceae bacterium]
MRSLAQLFYRNRDWARSMNEREPGFFQKLVKQQSPDYLWIGCADGRVPANNIVGMLPGELFVHRNVANVVVHRPELPVGAAVRSRRAGRRTCHRLRPLRLRRRAGGARQLTGWG